MNSVKILHCADIHIGAKESYLGQSANTRRYETLITFEEIVNLAQNNNVDFLLIAGDLFDSNQVEEGFVSTVFEKIASVPQINVVFAAGNHDPLNTESPFKNRELPKNLFVLATEDDCITFETLKTRVYGKSFENSFMQGEEDFKIKPQNDDFINICVLHGDLTSGLSSDYNSITPNFVKNSKMHYIALGHVHKRSDILKLGSTLFAYCGCPESHGFDETDKKGVYIGEITDNACNLEFVAVCKREHIVEKIDISNTKDNGEISQKILDTLHKNYGDDFAKNFYKIELAGEFTDEQNFDTNEILSRVSNEVYFAKIKDFTEPKIDYSSLANEVSLKGLFVKNMLSKIENAEENQKEMLKKALKLGLIAFNGEVAYNED